jgi:hypothetical protein
MQRHPEPQDLTVQQIKENLLKTAKLLRTELKQFQKHGEFTDAWNADKEWKASARVMADWFTFAINATTDTPVPHARFKRLRDVTSGLVCELEKRSE